MTSSALEVKSKLCDARHVVPRRSPEWVRCAYQRTGTSFLVKRAASVGEYDVAAGEDAS